MYVCTKGMVCCCACVQIEFYAKKTEEYGRQKTFREIHERKIVQLEAQCDRLRAENNVCYFSSFFFFSKTLLLS